MKTENKYQMKEQFEKWWQKHFTLILSALTSRNSMTNIRTLFYDCWDESASEQLKELKRKNIRSK